MESGYSQRKTAPISVILVFVALIIIGAALIPGLHFKLSPSRSNQNVNVNYQWSGTSARIIELEVTSKLENMFSSMKGLEQISSSSSLGSGRINMRFSKTADIDAVRFELSTIIRRVYPTLPEEVSYPVLSIGTNGNRRSPVLTYMLTSSADPFFIKAYAEENILPRLGRVEGVSEVSIYGESPFRYEIIFDQEKAGLLNIGSRDIISAVSEYYQSEMLGVYPSMTDSGEDREQQYRVILETLKLEPLNWDRIPVTSVNGRIIWLTDIARVVYRERPPQNFYRINGLNTVNIVLYPAEGTNHIEVANRVKLLVNQLNENLPKENTLLLTQDSTEFLVRELNKIGFRSAMSLIILLVFVWLVSRKIRYLLFITFSMLATLVISVIFYRLFNLEIHLYALAGITVSFGIIIDNSIVMIDHYRYRKNKRVFIAILAATLTTVGALSIIFLLKDDQVLNLLDFTAVTIINLTVSLFIALFFIPAMIDSFPLKTIRNRKFFRRKRRIARWVNRYISLLRFTKRWKWAFLVVAILGFGIPTHLLPNKIEKENSFAKMYNKTIGSSGFGNIKPVVDKVLGGSFRLFSEKTFQRSFYRDPDQTMLFVRGSMPEGSTVQQLNEVVRRMENYLSNFEEIEMFQTSIYSYENSQIRIYFKDEYEFGSFPYSLKAELTAKAISLGGLDWVISGVGRGFNNTVYTDTKSHHLKLTGYNYDQLYRYAEILKDSLDKHQRVRDSEIAGESEWRSRAINEFHVSIDQRKLALYDLNLYQYFNSIRDNALYRNMPAVFANGEKYNLTLVSENEQSFNRWDLMNNPSQIGNTIVKLGHLGDIEKVKTGKTIHKRNQEYILYINFNYIGPYTLANRVIGEVVENANERLPMGYKVSEDRYRGYWNRDDKTQYYLIFVVILIIYFICAILLESFLQPLAIILMIPISFVGVFLTYFLFKINFDQGGFAAFVLLCGLSVNSALYIINDFNNFRKDHPHFSPLTVYKKAFNHKIIPALLTILSTSIGLIPFLIGEQKDVFWFSFAAGTIGGLIFSLIALFIYFPLILNIAKNRLTPKSTDHDQK